MRTNMDPLTPTTSTLAPAISHVAETARSLAGPLQGRTVNEDLNKDTKDPVIAKKRKQQETVRWVLAAPQRLQKMIHTGRVDEANNDWRETNKLLQHWQGTAGVAELKDACLKILGHDSLAHSS